MGTILEFPVETASRRLGITMHGAPDKGLATVLILPVVRIERESGSGNGDRGPEEGKTPGRRRRRR